MQSLLYKIRFPLLALGMLSLVLGLWAGLLRLGIAAPELSLNLAELHGPLMVCGFLGTVIGLERAVALGSLWGYSAPLLSGAGSFALLLLFPSSLGRVMFTLAGLGLAAIFTVFMRRQFALATAIMATGVLLWTAGNAMWMTGASLYIVTPWWMGFIVFTIAGERLELSRLLVLTKRAEAMLITILVAIFAGSLAITMEPDHGAFIFGLGLLAASIWLFKNDIALRTVRQKGLTRFVAICLLAGYFWLGFAGAVAMLSGKWLPAGPVYDTVLHSIFLGFAFAMIFGHAPIIFPAILKKPLVYSPLFYAHFGLLMISLLIRVTGDMTGWSDGFRLGGVLNEISIALFLINTIAGVIRGTRKRRA